MRFLAVLAAALLACGGATPSDTLPPELLRTWRTQAPAYRDRTFELRPDWVIFGTGGYSTAMHPIQSVRLSRGTSPTRVVVAYRAEDGQTLEIQLEWTPGDPDRLRIGRREDVWVPETHARWLQEDAS